MCFQQRLKDIAPKKRVIREYPNGGNRIFYLSMSRIVANQCLNRGSPLWYCYALFLLSGATDFKLIPSIWRKLDRRRGWIKLLVLTCGESRRRADSYTSWLKSLVKEGILQAEPPFSWREMRGSCILRLFQFMTALFWEKVQFAETVSSQSAGTWPLSLPLWSCQQPPVTELHIEHPRSSHNPSKKIVTKTEKQKSEKTFPTMSRHWQSVTLRWSWCDRWEMAPQTQINPDLLSFASRARQEYSLLPELGRNIPFCQS